MKTFTLAISIMLFSGCAGMTYSNIKQGYVDAKVIYEDSKHIVYEIEQEKARIKKDGFGEAQ